MKRVQLKTVLIFICFLFISVDVFAGLGITSLSQRKLTVWDWLALSAVAIVLVSTVMTLVIGKSYISGWILNKSAQNDSLWDIDKLKSHAKELYFDLNKAISNREITSLSNSLTTEFYQEQQNIISELIEKRQKFIFKYLDIKVLEIIGCEDFKVDSKDRYTVFIEGEILNYRVAEASGEVIKDKYKDLRDFSCMCHFVRMENQWKLENINNSVSRLDVLKTKNLIE
ncbi:MAG: TIM44-like domain-containing protein [Paludibacter sp.]|nr:TIM44-like domain-containing protein [Paludibacter sp.]